MIWMGRTSSRGVTGWVLAALLIVFALLLPFLFRTPAAVRVYALVIPVFLVGLPAFAFVSRRLQSRKPIATDESSEAEHGEKPKRGDSLAELMALLNDEDIEDLRQRVKSRMIEQIETGTPEEVETFEQLLETPEKPSRKSGSPSNMNV